MLLDGCSGESLIDSESHLVSYLRETKGTLQEEPLARFQGGTGSEGG